MDAATGSIRMKATLPNRDEALMPGQFLDVSPTLETLRDAVTVPAEAPRQGPEGSLVFVVDADQSAQPRPVTLALVDGGRAAVTRVCKRASRWW